MFYTFLLQSYLKNGQKKKRRLHLSEVETGKIQNSAIMMISVHLKGILLPVKLKLQAELFEQRY